VRRGPGGGGHPARCADHGRGRPDRDARSCADQSGGYRTHVRGPGGDDHARLVPVTRVPRQAGTAVADRDDQRTFGEGPDVPRDLFGGRAGSAPAAGSRRRDRRRHLPAMNRATAAIVVVVILVVGAVATYARRRGTPSGPLPAATVTRTAFIDYLQL